MKYTSTPTQATRHPENLRYEQFSLHKTVGSRDGERECLGGEGLMVTQEFPVQQRKLCHQEQKGKSVLD